MDFDDLWKIAAMWVVGGLVATILATALLIAK
jgi:hypothetical protein